MEHSLQIYAIFVVFVLVIIRNIHEVNSTVTVSSKDELEAKLKEIYGNDGPLPDFVFYSQNDLLNYTRVKGTPFNRTERRRGKKPKPKNRTNAERIYARALNELNRNRHVEELNLVSYFVKLAMSDSSEKFISIFKRFTKRLKLYERGLDRVKGRKYHVRDRVERDLGDAQKRFFNHLFSDVIKELAQENEEDPENELEEQEETNRAYHAESRKENFQLSDRNDVNSYTRTDLEMDYDPASMRNDGASYTYTGTSTCYGEGSAGTTTSTIRLCATCIHEVDFGDLVTPQYANSVECVTESNSCLNGDGTCTQKIIYYTFQMLTGTDSSGKQVWTPYQQYLNTSCECECLSGSMIDTYFVGNSS